ncbi:ATP-dependent endonuclease [Methanobacterium sp. SMA-27]|uniref:ATP-dependent nuclease n=1 Tax=Methanobacterium sp. SMA-27 TaxID=1495336 RepID=UPI00064FC00F|nr:AAA family ATPase [Methanobacterium sp. SMA-27]
MIRTKIEKIKISGIKSHKNTTVNIEDYNILVGENNSGKSNIIFAIRWFFGHENLKISEDDISKGYSGDPSVIINFVFDDDETIPAQFINEFADETGKKFIVEAYCPFENLKVSSQRAKYRLRKAYKKEKDIGRISFNLDIIFVPSIRKLSDEFKFTSKSTIKKLVSKYVVETIKDDDKYLDIEKSINKMSDSLGKENNSPFNTLNESLKRYMLDYGNTDIAFNLKPQKVEDFVERSFEARINNSDLPLDSQGMGFQRSLIFSLLCNIADISIEDSNLSLYLIEEPELFLHPNHQDYFKRKLIDLSAMKNNQMILTSHSPYFLNNIKKEKYSQIKRVSIDNNISKLKEIRGDELYDICQRNGLMMAEAKNALRNTKWPADVLQRKADEITLEDELRYLLWIDPDRANAFLSKKVILVEGPTEKAIFSFIFQHDYGLYSGEKKTSEISVIDTVGKYHFFKFSNLLYKMGIPTWIMYDTDIDDDGNNINQNNKSISHKMLNDYVEDLKNEGIIIDCLKNHPDIEQALGFEKGYIPDISIYQNLVDNYKFCRNSDKYNEITDFVYNIINF